LPYHFAMHATAGRVVDDDVAFGAYTGIDVMINAGIARGAVIRVTGMHRHHTGTSVIAIVGILRNFAGLGRKMRILAFKRHAAGRSDGYDDFFLGHVGWLQN